MITAFGRPGRVDHIAGARLAQQCADVLRLLVVERLDVAAAEKPSQLNRAG
jgi:hypothetical protein